MGRKRKKLIIEDLLIEKYAAEGKSIGYFDEGKAIFVKGVVPGDRARVLVKKNKPSFAEGVLLNIVKEAEERISPFCDDFNVCGGCKWQMLTYERQLEYKQQQVVDQLSRIGGIELPAVSPIIGSLSTERYRNKLEFTFSELTYLTKEEIERSKDMEITKPPSLGFHAPGMFDKVVNIEECHLMQEPTNKIKNTLRTYTKQKGFSYYNARKQEGWLRNVVLRISSTGEIMVNLVVKEMTDDLFPLLDHLIQEVPEITSLNYTINSKVNDTLYDLDIILYKGKPYIEEKLEDFTFRISPKSFFQTNTKQAERLYQVVRDYAALEHSEIIYDLYCGTGSIGIFLSKNVKKIVGIETVPEAIEDAKVNARINGLENTTFLAGDVIKVINDDFYKQHGKPDVVITDPPRAGMHETMINKLIEISAPKIVYVSCNPATQARDLKLLSSHYKVTKVQPVDMFPHTHHIESVACLELKEKSEEL